VQIEASCGRVHPPLCRSSVADMRRSRRVASGSLSVGLGLALSASPAPRGATPAWRRRNWAAEVCEPMVATAVEGAIGSPLRCPSRELGVADRYVCTYTSATAG